MGSWSDRRNAHAELRGIQRDTETNMLGEKVRFFSLRQNTHARTHAHTHTCTHARRPSMFMLTAFFPDDNGRLCLYAAGFCY